MTRSSLRLVREGKFAAEVAVNLIEEDGGWSPYLSAGDASKLDEMRKALQMGDLTAASKLGRVFELTLLSF